MAAPAGNHSVYVKVHFILVLSKYSSLGCKSEGPGRHTSRLLGAPAETIQTCADILLLLCCRLVKGEQSGALDLFGGGGTRGQLNLGQFNVHVSILDPIAPAGPSKVLSMLRRDTLTRHKIFCHRSKCLGRFWKTVHFNRVKQALTITVSAPKSIRRQRALHRSCFQSPLKSSYLDIPSASLLVVSNSLNF